MELKAQLRKALLFEEPKKNRMNKAEFRGLLRTLWHKGKNDVGPCPFGSKGSHYLKFGQISWGFENR